MKNEIIKYSQMYRVIFKEDEPRIITEQAFKIISNSLKKNEWIEIDGELYNPFEVRKIVKFRTQDGILQLLRNENEETQIKVRKIMQEYGKEVTIGILKNMIKKAKNIY